MEPHRVEPGPGQESVWGYPRPPRLDPSTQQIRVQLGGVIIAETTRSIRVLETSQPPTYYVPPDDCDLSLLRPNTRRTFCEWKGLAAYVDVILGERQVPSAGWTYDDPVPAFAPIAGHLAFYAQLLDCSVDGERAVPNEGSFYGGWVTSQIVGPFKGAAGTAHW